jgi:polar amino acid transport system ATP-binding protein
MYYGPENNVSNTSAPVLEMRHVGKSFANHVVLNDINLRVDHGEIVTLIGPSGSGKPPRYAA